MTEVPGPELKEAALAYGGRGWLVLPIAARGKLPVKEEGLFEHGVNDAKKSPFWLNRFWARWPSANVALAAGEESGFWVLDADLKAATEDHQGEDGRATLAQLEGLFGEPLPDTLGQETPSGGRHWLFDWPGKKVPNSARKRLGPGLDTRGDSGYILAAPSIHPNGSRYRWVGGDPLTARPARAPEWLLRLLFGEPDDLEWLRARLDGAELPDWLAKRIGRPVAGAAVAASKAAARADRLHPYARRALEDECATVRKTLPGGQNNALNNAAFKLGGLVGSSALPEGLVKAQLIAAACAWQYDPRKGPWKREHIEKIVDQGVAAGMLQPRDVPALPETGRGPRQAGPRRPPPPTPEAIEAARSIWAQRQPITGTSAGRLVADCGVDPTQPWPMLGFVDALDVVLAQPGTAEPVKLPPAPALVACMGRWTAHGADKAVSAVYVLHLTGDGHGLRVEHPTTGKLVLATRTVGAWAGSAMRLTPLFAPRLILSVGLRAGLRALAARQDIPVWAVGYLGTAPFVAMPEGVTDVLIVGAERAMPEQERNIATALGGEGARTVRFVRPTRERRVA